MNLKQIDDFKNLVTNANVSDEEVNDALDIIIEDIIKRGPDMVRDNITHQEWCLRIEDMHQEIEQIRTLLETYRKTLYDILFRNVQILFGKMI